MSLVGTRPILPDELEQYELHHRARIAIKPGITGISVPGMPANSPGMGSETQGTLKIYEIAGKPSGKPRVFSIE